MSTTPQSLAPESLRPFASLAGALVQIHAIEIRAKDGERVARGQVPLLIWLSQNPCTVCEVAEFLNSSNANASGVIDGLVKAGLVNRATPETDRRRRQLSLTPLAIRQLEAHLAAA